MGTKDPSCKLIQSSMKTYVGLSGSHVRATDGSRQIVAGADRLVHPVLDDGDDPVIPRETKNLIGKPFLDHEGRSWCNRGESRRK